MVVPLCVESIVKLLKTWNGSPTVCGKYNQASKNWNSSRLFLVSIVKLLRTGMVVPQSIASKYSHRGKNWNSNPLCVVSIVKLVTTGMIVPCL